MMPVTLHARFGALLVCCALIGCGEDNAPAPLPEGEQQMTGILQPAELSLVRRGTHVFNIDGTDTYFVESSAINLPRYENKEVELKGVLEHNVSDEFLPLFVVSEVVNVIEEETKEWTIRSLGVTLDLPETWAGTIEPGNAVFIAPGKEDPALTVSEATFETEEDEPVGTPVVVGNNRGVRVSDEATGEQVVYVETDDRFIVFSFDPSGHENPEQLRAVWLEVLNDVIISRRPSDPSVPTGTGGTPGLGMPCGGSAGILCPEGYYCDVTNIEENIGTCQTI